MAIKRSKRPPLVGTTTVPGDKSVSHRALLLAALADGRSRITNLNPGRDVSATADAIEALGATVRKISHLELEVEGCGAEGPREPENAIDAGNSGTTARCLLGVAAGISGVTTVTGDDSLRARPMLRVVSPLRQMGAIVDGRHHGDRLPVTVRGGNLEGIDLHPPSASAQVKTAVLLAGLSATGTTTVVELAQSRDHTERMLKAAGVDVRIDGLRVSLDGPVRPRSRAWEVPGDLSAALFLIVAATVVPGSDITITDVGLNPTRDRALDVLRRMGADIEATESSTGEPEPRGSIRVRSAELNGIQIGADVVPEIIDEIPALVIAASCARGKTEISGAGELRVKESDRIEALVEGIEALGGKAHARPDGLEIEGAPLDGGEIDPRGDHRIALAFAVAALVASSNVRVRDWSCVDVSWPGFADVLARLQTTS